MHIKRVEMNSDRALVLESTLRITENKPRETDSKGLERAMTQVGTKQHKDSLQRAFNRVKQQVFFNPDMIYFVTLTYAGKTHTPEDVLNDIKMFMKSTRRKGYKPKYVAVMEYQKRGSIHVHMITNGEYEMNRNSNGYLEYTDWGHGYSSILTIGDFDDNFKPFLYLFKYMSKSERIGKSFVYSSRNLKNSFKLPVDFFDARLYDELAMEQTQAIMPDGKTIIYRKYYFQRRPEHDD